MSFMLEKLDNMQRIMLFFIYLTSLPAISGLGLEWYPLPGVSWLMTEIGGLQFPATPFTGWYSSIEILRDFLEDNRYPGVCEVSITKIVRVQEWCNENRNVVW